MRRAALLLLLTACGSTPTAYSVTTGILRPHERIVVHIAGGIVNAYAPREGQPADAYTIQAFAPESGPAPAAPRIRPISQGIEVDAPAMRVLLVRVPENVDLTVVSQNGDVNVTDISGNANVTLHNGNGEIMIPGYAQASVTGAGDLKVILGALTWPGTLHFSAEQGDVNVSINENARFHAFLHTGDGTIFTDFNLRGTSRGSSETIDSDVNGGGPRSVSVLSQSGTVRLLQQAPQY